MQSSVYTSPGAARSPFLVRKRPTLHHACRGHRGLRGHDPARLHTRYLRLRSRGDGRVEDSGQKSPGLPSLAPYRKRSCPLPTLHSLPSGKEATKESDTSSSHSLSIILSRPVCPEATGNCRKFSPSILSGGKHGPNSFLRHHYMLPLNTRGQANGNENNRNPATDRVNAP